MHPPRVLVVDDDACQRRMLARFLSSRGFLPAATASAAGALGLVRSFQPELALVDIAMPKVSGIKLLEFLRAAPATARLPVMLMTGLPVPEEMVAATAKGLEAGPIFVKGGDLFVLADRIRAALNAGLGVEPFARCLRRGALAVDPNGHQASFAGERIHLGRSLFDLLCALMRSSEPLGREALRELLWSESDAGGIVHVAVQRLRGALAKYPGVRIEAVGGGFILTVGEGRSDVSPA
jgi:DNA-binding response OmpR family regulator